MSDNSNIEWTDATWNPIRFRNHATGGVGHFCEKVSEECAHCYAARMQKRFQNPIRYNAADRDKGDVFLDETVLTQPLRWQRPRMIFPCSMTDLFGEWVPDEWIDRIYAVMALADRHTFQVVTKRSGRMRDYLNRVQRRDRFRRRSYSSLWVITQALHSGESHWRDVFLEKWPPPNVWHGVSVGSQDYVHRIQDLIAVPSDVRFISAEPLLGPIDLFGEQNAHPCGDPPLIDWVIVGGESGPQARPMHPQWVRDLRDQSTAAGVPFFFKQWGEWTAGSELLEKSVSYFTHEWGNAFGPPVRSFRVGKKRAGRMLDGRKWSEFPRQNTAVR